MAPIPLLSLANQTLDDTIGAMSIGLIGASIIFGLTTVQTYWYYRAYRDDSMCYRISVAVLWLLDAFHLALITHALYTYTVVGFGDLTTVMNITWSIKLQASVNLIIILIVHSLYTMRVWLLGGYHRGLLAYVISSIVVAGSAIGIVFAYSLYRIDTYTQLEDIAWTLYAALGSSTTIDFALAAAMCYYLRKSMGSLTGLNSRISMVMQYSLNSGLLTTACSLSSMFCYILLPNTFIFLAIGFLLTKLYVNSFVSMLNARRRNYHGISSSNIVSIGNMTYKPQLNFQTTSSFWSPRPLSMESFEMPFPTTVKTPPATYHSR